jgi:nickel-dependent lactate racemase
MRVQLAYGDNGLSVEFPDHADVIYPHHVEGLADEPAALRQALRAPIDKAPLREIAPTEGVIAVVFSDLTRPMPNRRVLPVLLAELAHIPDDHIVLINALGTHRPSTREELVWMLGEEIVARYRIEQHDAFDPARLVHLGQTRRGLPIYVNKTYVEAAFRIVTGFIEPHIFAGFSGGPKGVMPGISGIETIMRNHGYEMLAEPNATWGRTLDNPIWNELHEVASAATVDFLLNVSVNREKQITGVFAGDLDAAHQAGVAHVRRSAIVEVDEPYDVVVTTNTGYPLDLNLYQSGKGISAAQQITKKGGAIVIASECRDGVPEWGEYRTIVLEGGSPQGIMELVGQPGYRRHDQWQAQLQAMAQLHADVYVHCAGIPDDELERLYFHPCPDVAACVAALLAEAGPGARLCVLPEGPQTIPTLRRR